MIAKRLTFLITMVAFGVLLRAQESFEFDGQFSAFGSYHPDNARELLTGGRYIPELNYHIGLPSSRNLDSLPSLRSLPGY